jgi:hypothetical protein
VSGDAALSRSTLLRRAGGASLALGGAAWLLTPAARADDDADRANARLMASTKVLTITWYARWLGTARALTAQQRSLARTIAHHEQEHYDVLAPIVGDTAPVADDFSFSLPAKALHDPDAALAFTLSLEHLSCAIAIGATSTTTNVGVAEVLARIAAADSNHAGALSGLAGRPLGPALPPPTDVVGASDALARYLGA